MPKQIFTNNATSVLSTAVNTSVTSLVLSNAAKFPSPTGGDWFYAALIGLDGNGTEISWEIVKCTARATNTLTVIRAQEGTVAAAWPGGTRVELRITAEFVNTVALAGPLSSSGITGAAASGANTDITSLSNISSINGGQLAGLRSLVINGSFGVWQRGTSFTLSSSGTYTADRWIGAAAGANLSAIRGAGFSSQYAFALSGAVGNTFAFLKHRIESVNAYSLTNRTVTLSGRIFNNSAVVVPCTVELNFATAADNFSAVTYIEGKSVPLAANSWTFVSFTTTGPLPAGVTAGLEVSINLTSGLPNGTSIAISDIQLEVGPVATPFELRPYGLELALCRRYTRKQSVWVGTSAAHTCFPIDMLKTPVITGGGGGFTSTGTTLDTLDCYQTTAGAQTLLLDGEL